MYRKRKGTCAAGGLSTVELLLLSCSAGTIQQLQKEGKDSVILREEPFEIAKDSIGYQIHLMIWEKGILNRKVKIESYSLEKNKE